MPFPRGRRWRGASQSPETLADILGGAEIGTKLHENQDGLAIAAVPCGMRSDQA